MATNKQYRIHIKKIRADYIIVELVEPYMSEYAGTWKYDDISDAEAKVEELKSMYENHVVCTFLY